MHVQFVYMLRSACLLSSFPCPVFVLVLLHVQTTPLPLFVSLRLLSPCSATQTSGKIALEMKTDVISSVRGPGANLGATALWPSDICPPALCDFICLTFTCSGEIYPAAHSSAYTVSGGDSVSPQQAAGMCSWHFHCFSVVSSGLAGFLQSHWLHYCSVWQ